MEPYWKHHYKILIGNREEHLLRLYNFSSRQVFLTCTPEFYKAFEEVLTMAGGEFQEGLKVGNMDKSDPGWLFTSEPKTQEILGQILKDIHLGKIPPKKISSPTEERENCDKIFGFLSKAFELVPEGKKTVTFQSPHMEVNY